MFSGLISPVSFPYLLIASHASIFKKLEYILHLLLLLCFLTFLCVPTFYWTITHRKSAQIIRMYLTEFSLEGHLLKHILGTLEVPSWCLPSPCLLFGWEPLCGSLMMSQPHFDPVSSHTVPNGLELNLAVRCRPGSWREALAICTQIVHIKTVEWRLRSLCGWATWRNSEPTLQEWCAVSIQQRSLWNKLFYFSLLLFIPWEKKQLFLLQIC